MVKVSRVRPTPTADRIAYTGLGLTVLFVAAHCAVNLCWTLHDYVPAAVRRELDLRDDYSIPSWFGFGCFFAAGVAWLGLANRLRHLGAAATGLLFVCLGMDDSLMLHERLGQQVFSKLGGLCVYAWLPLLAPVLAALGIATFRSAWRLQSDRRDRARLLCGYACLGLAIGIESLEQFTGSLALRWRGFEIVQYFQVLEELLEFVGPLLICWVGAAGWERASARKPVQIRRAA